jgi:hypothetical protein
MIAYLAFVLGFAVLGALALADRRSRYAATVLVVCLALSGPWVYWSMLSHPKLLTDETRSDEQVEILAYSAKEGIAVYYWLRLPGVDEPRYYYEEWSEAAKKRLQDMQNAREGGQRMAFILPFEPSLIEDKKIHPLPQPKLSTKPAPPPTRQFSI